MPDGFDVAARLATGQPSVDRVATYVLACRQLGYQHPDLTMHAAQVRDWYANDDGLDLGALDADCDALAAAAVAADDAVRRHGELAAELAGAWSGGGAASAREFLLRHGQSAVAVRDGLRRAVDAMTALRDELWRAVDEKVSAVLDIDGRRLPQRDEWLAAARAVTTGAGDVAAASELVDQQIKPFVDNDIRSDWLTAMHRANASVTAAYDAAIARLDSGPGAFDVPGELGPRWEQPEGAPAPVAAVPIAAVPGATVPAAAVMSSPPPAFDPPAAAPPQAPVAEPPAAPPAAMPASPMPSFGEIGGGTPSLGPGASGFGQQLADLIGGLVGSGATGEDTSKGALPDPPELDPADGVDEPGKDPEEDSGTESSDASDEPGDEDGAEGPDDGRAPPDEAELDPEPVPPEPASTAVPPPEPTPPIPPAVPEAMPAEQTPCEIAADELPQVGE